MSQQTGHGANHCWSLSWTLLNPVLERVRKILSPRWILTRQGGRGCLEGQTQNSVWPKRKLVCIGTALTLCPSYPGCFFHLLQYCIQKWWCNPSWQLSETVHLQRRRSTCYASGESVSITSPSLVNEVPISTPRTAHSLHPVGFKPTNPFLYVPIPWMSLKRQQGHLDCLEIQRV